MKFRREWWYVVGLAVIIVFLIIIFSQQSLFTAPRQSVSPTYAVDSLEEFLGNQRTIKVDGLNDLGKLGGEFKDASDELANKLFNSRGTSNAE